ncbi:MAG: hypothetical protein SFW07_01435 [Gammaproteobacteria bacterium]|nr:hypothetical protein [Gammaproteobacteria bacterium]
MQEPKNNRAIHAAISKNKLIKLDEIIQKKIQTERRYSINVKNANGLTPLALACATRPVNLNIVQSLMKAGADVTDGKPLVLAVFLGGGGALNAVAKLLIEAGADVNEVNGDGNSVFCLVCRDYSDLDLAAYMAPHVKDIDATNNLGLTTLAVVCQKNKIPTINFLLEKGADPEKVLPSVYEKLSPDLRYILDGARKNKSDRPPQEAYRTSQLVYSTPAGRHAMLAPQQNNFAQNMNATANVLNAVGRAGEGISQAVNAFNGV